MITCDKNDLCRTFSFMSLSPWDAVMWLLNQMGLPLQHYRPKHYTLMLSTDYLPCSAGSLKKVKTAQNSCYHPPLPLTVVVVHECSAFLARSKVRCGRYGLTNQSLYWVCEIRMSLGRDGGEVRRADFGPTSLALLLGQRLQHLGLSLFSCGKHEDWFCPAGLACAKETADSRRAAVGLLLPWPGWVYMFILFMSTGNTGKGVNGGVLVGWYCS